MRLFSGVQISHFMICVVSEIAGCLVLLLFLGGGFQKHIGQGRIKRVECCQMLVELFLGPVDMIKVLLIKVTIIERDFKVHQLMLEHG